MEEKYYLTEKGLEEIERKLEEAKERKMEIIQKRAPDRLDYREADAEYMEYQGEMEQLEKKIKEFERVLDRYELIKSPPEEERNKVLPGALVSIELNESVEEFRIVGTWEADPAEGRISVRSPVGQALLGKKIGEEVRIETAVIKQRCRILKIKYE